MPNSKVKHIPCGPFANESEQIAYEKLKTKLLGVHSPGSWIFLTNIPLNVQAQFYSDEIDLLVIGPPGVIVIEIKHWDTNYLKDNSDIVESEVERLNNKAKKVAGKLRKRFNVGFVEGRVLLTKGNIRLFSANSKKIIRGIGFYGLPDWEELLNINAASELDNRAIEAVCRELEPKTKISLTGDIRTFANLTNLELISTKEERFHRIYKGLHVSRRDRVILHLYDLSASDDKNALERAKREYKTLQRLQKSPYLPRMLDSFQFAHEYPGEICFYSIVDPLVPNLKERAKDQTWSFQQRLYTAASIAQALAELHQPIDPIDPKIIHRNLSPESIRIKANDQPLFTDLDFTKLPDETSVSPGMNSFAGKEKYVAPEVLKDGLKVADARSDIYSLCASLTLLFENLPENGNSALALIQKGLAENPGDRIGLKELAEEFSKIATQTTSADIDGIPPVQYWDEDTVVSFKNSYYVILNKLGSGGIGTTFKVVETDKKREAEFGTYVAKVIFNKDNGALALQAYRKVRAYSSHPHLAVIYEIAPQWEGNHFVALMKWVEGMPLSDLKGVLPLHAEDIGEVSCESLVLRWLGDLCEALSSLHRVNLVHGDVTPKNIIVSGGDITLTDFDAVIEGGGKPRIETALYSAPSISKYKNIWPTDDIYALAASFFHVLFDQEPFRFEGELSKDYGLNWEGIKRWPGLFRQPEAVFK